MKDMIGFEEPDIPQRNKALVNSVKTSTGLPNIQYES